MARPVVFANGEESASRFFPAELPYPRELNLISVPMPEIRYVMFYIARELTVDDIYKRLLEKQLITSTRFVKFFER